MQSAHTHTGLKRGAAQQEHQTLIAEPEVGKHTLMFLSSFLENWLSAGVLMKYNTTQAHHEYSVPQFFAIIGLCREALPSSPRADN
tara:strand:- start:39797 stop:40054 length:258 start_codon:yes stop_codon:yes gene_type:complete